MDGVKLMSFLRAAGFNGADAMAMKAVLTTTRPAATRHRVHREPWDVNACRSAPAGNTPAGF